MRATAAPGQASPIRTRLHRLYAVKIVPTVCIHVLPHESTPVRELNAASRVQVEYGPCMDLAITIIGALAAVGAAVAAFGSWTAARIANRTTTTMAAIEGDRRRDALAPDFDITCVERATAPDSADLRISLKPGRLESNR
jgi:hypothetical protein